MQAFLFLSSCCQTKILSLTYTRFSVHRTGEAFWYQEGGCRGSCYTLLWAPVLLVTPGVANGVIIETWIQMNLMFHSTTFLSFSIYFYFDWASAPNLFSKSQYSKNDFEQTNKQTRKNICLSFTAALPVVTNCLHSHHTQNTFTSCKVSQILIPW